MKTRLMFVIATLVMPAAVMLGLATVSSSNAAPLVGLPHAGLEWTTDGDCWLIYNQGQNAADAYQRAEIEGDEEGMWKAKTMWKLALGAWMNKGCVGFFPSLGGSDLPDIDPLG